MGKPILHNYTDSTGFVVRSKSYGEMLGYEPAELTDRLLWETTLIHPEDLPRLKAALDSYL
ncbi:PAS domain-containing protein, partial [Candidatus Darwinibacter acetoxidans]